MVLLSALLTRVVAPRTVNTKSTEYIHFLIPYSILCIAIYPVGINALYVVLLWWNRSEIRLEKDRAIDADSKQKLIGDGTMISFLHLPYSRTYFWWEAVDSVGGAARSKRNLVCIVPNQCKFSFLFRRLDVCCWSECQPWLSCLLLDWSLL